MANGEIAAKAGLRADTEPGGEPSAAARWLRLVLSLVACGRQSRHAIAAGCRPLGLADHELLLLASCAAAEQEGRCQTALAIELGLSTPHICQLVEQLRGRGWIVGERSARDRRRQHWRLTPAGQEQFSAALQALEHLAVHLDDVLKPSSRQSLAEQLALVTRALSELPAAPAVSPAKLPHASQREAA